MHYDTKIYIDLQSNSSMKHAHKKDRRSNRSFAEFIRYEVDAIHHR